MDKVRIAVVGLGGRGVGLIKNCLLNMRDVEITAVCDTYPDRVKAAEDIVFKKSKKRPFGEVDYKNVIGRDDVDVVMVAAAWEAHIIISCEAMRQGKFVGLEVGGAYCVEDCFELIRAQEESGSYCMLLENCCYGKYELMAKNMARQGVFGTIVHCEGGYCHDLRNEIANGDKNRHYRLRNYISRNCENYPTHELGPIAKLLKINNGNRIVSLASFGSKSEGLKAYVKDKLSTDSPLRNIEFKQSDVVTTVLKCENGETIVMSLDTTLPRSYSRRFTVRGTKGMYFEDSKTVFLDGNYGFLEYLPRLWWHNAGKYARKYGSELWKKSSVKQRALGHGGMDWFVLRAMIETVKQGKYPPIDVYDAALWMSITPLSERSIKEGGAVVEVPDFTNGRWKEGIVRDVVPEYDLK
jgi:Predicted dehydrogenases and related proteins